MTNLESFSGLTKPQDGKTYSDLFSKCFPKQGSFSILAATAPFTSKHIFRGSDIYQALTLKFPELTLTAKLSTKDAHFHFAAEHIPDENKNLKLRG